MQYRAVKWQNLSFATWEGEMITAGHAARAAAVLRNRLSSRWWLDFVELRQKQEGYVVKVRVSRMAGDVSVAVPNEIEGVPVELAAAS
jgi:hypothetical protein